MQILTSQHMVLMLGEGAAIGRLDQGPMSTSSCLNFHSSPSAETSQDGEEMLANADISNTAPLRKVCPKIVPMSTLFTKARGGRWVQHPKLLGPLLGTP